ncbi:MAG: tryptophan 7-halogenase [Acidimicrobiia bacterium]|nr:tryptophan 7-halogenase [Acidimicrobiia bacterium]
MGEPIRDVTIIGGGTAGWLTASAILSAVAIPGQDPPLAITVIESPTIPSIGVGEAALPALHSLIDFLGIDEREFLRRTNAAFKLGGHFVNWNHGPDGEPMSFLNIMNRPPDGTVGTIADLFLAFHPEREAPTAGQAYTRLISPATDIVDRRLGPFPEGSGPQRSGVNYSYHFDASQLAELMKDRAAQFGVNHVLDDVDDVELDERGFIQALTLRERGRFPVQLVIDCTGFQSNLLGHHLKVPFEPYERHLLNDRALVAVGIPHADPTRIEPATRMTGMQAGWSFQTPLFNRVGAGYVFSSRFCSEDEALAEMTALLGPAFEEAEPRVIPMRLGHRQRHWVKNCVALGLSSGFIEPLEATAIFTVQRGINMLLKSWPTQAYESELAERFDRNMNGLYDEIRDFIFLHFYLSNRTDTPYWVAARQEVEVPDAVQHNLAVWRHTLPGPEDLRSQHVFSHSVFTLLLIAKNYYKGRQLPAAHLLSKEPWDHRARQLETQRRQYLRTLPDHYQLLRALRRQDAPPLRLSRAERRSRERKKT